MVGKECKRSVIAERVELAGEGNRRAHHSSTDTGKAVQTHYRPGGYPTSSTQGKWFGSVPSAPICCNLLLLEKSGLKMETFTIVVSNLQMKNEWERSHSNHFFFSTRCKNIIFKRHGISPVIASRERELFLLWNASYVGVRKIREEL